MFYHTADRELNDSLVVLLEVVHLSNCGISLLHRDSYGGHHHQPHNLKLKGQIAGSVSSQDFVSLDDNRELPMVFMCSCSN